MMKFVVAAASASVLGVLLAACESLPSTQEEAEAVKQTITGGQVATGYPAVGCLKSSSGSSCNCTGTLIAPSVVLTAKHCDGMGVFQLGPTGEAPTHSRNVDKEIRFHPEEDVETDISIYHLQSPIFDVRPLPINTSGVPGNGSSCIGVGFGNDSSKGTKYAASMNVVDSGQVGVTLFEIGYVALRSAIKVTAAGANASPPGGDTEGGDSGGPLLCNGRIAGVLTGHVTWPLSGTYYTALDTSLTFSAAWVTNVASNYVNEPMVSAVSWGPNRIDLFGRGTDGALYHKAYDPSVPGTHWWPSTYDWEYRGGFISGTPEAVSWGPNRIDVFVRGGDSNPESDNLNSMSLWHHYWNGSNWYWQDLGGVLAARPSAVSWGSGRVDVVTLGTDGYLWHIGGNGETFGSWERAPTSGGPSQFLGPVKAISVAPGGFDIYATGTDNMLYRSKYQMVSYTVYQGPYAGYVTVTYPIWTGWTNIGGPVFGTPAVATWGGGREDIYVKGSNNEVLHKWLDSAGWHPSASSFESLGGPIDGSPAAASMKANWMTLVSNGPNTAQSDSVLYKGWFNGTQWYPTNTTWLNIGTMPSGVPVLLANPGVGINNFTLGGSFTPGISGYTPNGPSATYGWTGSGSLGGVLSW